jgi:hypothetical protein
MDFSLTSGVSIKSDQAHFKVGNAPGSVAVGDFNGDGLPDLALVSGGSVSILINTTR